MYCRMPRRSVGFTLSYKYAYDQEISIQFAVLFNSIFEPWLSNCEVADQPITRKNSKSGACKNSSEVDVIRDACLAGFVKQTDQGGAFGYAGCSADQKNESGVRLRFLQREVVIPVARYHDPSLAVGVSSSKSPTGTPLPFNVALA